MGIFITGIKIECDHCQKAAREIVNEGRLPAYALENKLVAEGWAVGWGGNCLCPTCKIKAEATYQLSLKKKKIPINSPRYKDNEEIATI